MVYGWSLRAEGTREWRQEGVQRAGFKKGKQRVFFFFLYFQDQIMGIKIRLQAEVSL